MSMSVSLHVAKNQWVERELVVESKLQYDEVNINAYPVIGLKVKENDVVTSDITLFLDMDQVKQLYKELGDLINLPF